jgi:tripartite-type tricarboxylate transporter receptor subunit TctC
MRYLTVRHASVAMLIAASLAGAGPLSAQSAKDFYQGKNLTVVVGATAGGSYDLTARSVGRHLPNHLPGLSTVIVRNMPGAGGLTSVLHLDSTAPKDGTVLSAFNGGMISDSVSAAEQAKTKFTDYAWIGSVMRDLRICFTWGEAKVPTWDDLLKRKEIVFGATGLNSNSYNGAATMRNLFGANIKIISAYPGGSEVRIAMERGEVEGSCSSWAAMPEAWVQGKKIDILVRLSAGTAPGIPPSVPFLGDLAKTQDQKDIINILKAPADLGRPYIASKEVPADRIALLRAAFDAMMQDPAFKAEAEKQGIWVDPISGPDAQAMIEKLYSFSPDVIAKMQAALK